MDVRLVFPNQLFADLVETRDDRYVFVEHPLFFTQFPFHVQKLMMHHASMRLFQERLTALGKEVCLVSVDECASPDKWQGMMRAICGSADRLICYDLVDDWLERAVRQLAEDLDLPLVIEETPSFLTDRKTLQQYRDTHPNRLRMADFYVWQRKRLDVLLAPGQKPLGGAWSFDAENRKRLPRKTPVPALEGCCYNARETELLEEAAVRYSKNYGSRDGFLHPITHEQAEWWLEQFLEQRFNLFGEYEDAIVENQNTLFHSRVSAALNSGLLTPDQVLDAALTFAEKEGIPLNSVEGFVRQVIGWREFMRATYVWVGRKMRTRNYLKHTQELPHGIWDATTGIRPLDAAIERVLAEAYTHHIERLMVLGCFMLLNETHPDQVYAWYMTLFIDAYDWVMVPNVYGMSQYADGGLIITKPYICGSNYLLKMSHYSKEEWSDIWDGLYWRFVDRHRELLRANQRLSFSVRTYDTMAEERKASLTAAVDRYQESSQK